MDFVSLLTCNRDGLGIGPAFTAGRDMNPHNRARSGLLSLRSALVLALALLAAGLVGGLTWCARRNPAEAALAIVTAFPVAAAFMDWLIM
jgi:hypothetical protein